MSFILSGTLVNYRPREGEPGSPAIVLQQWPDESLQLHVFHFEAGTHIRAAVEAEYDIILNPTEFIAMVEKHDFLEHRVSDLEDVLDKISPLLLRLQKLVDDNIPTQPLANSPAPVSVDASELDLESDMPIKLNVDSTQEPALNHTALNQIDPDEPETQPDPWAKKKKR